MTCSSQYYTMEIDLASPRHALRGLKLRRHFQKNVQKRFYSHLKKWKIAAVLRQNSGQLKFQFHFKAAIKLACLRDPIKGNWNQMGI